MPRLLRVHRPGAIYLIIKTAGANPKWPIASSWICSPRTPPKLRRISIESRCGRTLPRLQNPTPQKSLRDRQLNRCSGQTDPQPAPTPYPPSAICTPPRLSVSSVKSVVDLPGAGNISQFGLILVSPFYQLTHLQQFTAVTSARTRQLYPAIKARAEPLIAEEFKCSKWK